MKDLPKSHNIDKKTLTNYIAKEFGVSKKITRTFYECVEEVIFELLSSVTPEYTKDNPMIIKLFDGINLEGYYAPEKEKKVNYTDETVTVKSRIKVKANVTRNYIRKVTANNISTN